MKDFSGFQGKTNGEARRLPFFLAASFGTGMVYTDEAGVKAFLNGATGIIAWDPGSSGKDEGNALALLVACSEIQFFRANPAYENPPVYLEGSEGSKDDLPEWAGDMKPGWEYEQFHTGSVWAKRGFDTEWSQKVYSGCIGTFKLHPNWQTHVWRLSAGGQVEAFENPDGPFKYSEYDPADKAVPEFAKRMLAGWFVVQNPDGTVWDSLKAPKGYSGGGWSLGYPSKFLGKFPLTWDHATTYWERTVEGKIVKVVANKILGDPKSLPVEQEVSEATGEAPKRAE